MQTTSSPSKTDTSTTIDERVHTLLAQMTLPEKIGQMTQVEKDSITPAEVSSYFIGSVLSGGGGNPDPNNPAMWREMVLAFVKAATETRTGIPLLYGADAVHGHSNVKGAVIFPHNIGLGATRNPDLLRRIAAVTARELQATGVHWDFAPAVSVPQDIRWGRTYEGYSEDTALVTELATAYIEGLHTRQSDGTFVLPSVKHFVADGATAWNSRIPTPWISDNWQAAGTDWMIDQGDAQIDEATLREIHLAPYQAALDAGALNVMASFSSWNSTKLHEHHYLLTEVLKGEMGFSGFIVSDWMAIDQISEDFYECVVRGINAGLDMIMVPYDFKRFISALTEAVQKGDVTQERIDDAVKRILTVKFELGLFDAPITDQSLLDDVGSAEHRAVAAEAVQQSAVLLKNDGVLPVSKDAGIFIAGKAADDIGIACGGWTIQWTGGSGAVTAGSSLLYGMHAGSTGDIAYSAGADFVSGEKVDIGIVTIHEDPYAEGHGDKDDLTIKEEHVALIKKMRQQCQKLILIMYSGRPIIITDVVDDCDAIIAAWLPGSEAHALAPLLYGEIPFTGKLPVSYPRDMSQVPLTALKASSEEPLWPFGYGL